MVGIGIHHSCLVLVDGQAKEGLTLLRISSFLLLSLFSSPLLRRTTSEKCLGLSATLVKWRCSTELKTTSRERGRMPGSGEVPVTVYVLPREGRAQSGDGVTDTGASRRGDNRYAADLNS